MLAIEVMSRYCAALEHRSPPVADNHRQHLQRPRNKFSAFSQIRIPSTLRWLAPRLRHTGVVWWILWIVIVWVVLSIPLAILIGKAARQKDRREKLPRRRTSRTGGPPDQTAA